ncbi:B12-binding domain/radical SAM domain-containing protein [Patescibacteria group bacterium]|nr:B12-binding domain/radical SAM domain-containing protein [Patescibacteria group bacterium]
MAVSAPEYPRGKTYTDSLSSPTPVSLYNACRQAAMLAEDGIGAWGVSNWHCPREERAKTFLLMRSFQEEADVFRAMLERIKPNLLLIGAMTICLPGAIECAKIAKEMFGPKIATVLGGKHVNESFFLQKGSDTPQHHPSSPLRLMAEREIEPVFDVVFSGEAEFVIPLIGEIVYQLKHSGANNLGQSLGQKLLSHKNANTPGSWLMGSLQAGVIETLSSNGIPFDRNNLPTPAKMFGVEGCFDVFGPNSITGHAFSDIGSGCVFDCGYCSERRSIADSPLQTESAALRLVRQFQDICAVVARDHIGKNASAFVEDSIMLGGIATQLEVLAYLLEINPFQISFGGQLTIDIAIKLLKEKPEIIKRLFDKGFMYLFVGLETLDPGLIGGFSKDISNHSWMTRANSVIKDYTRIGFKIGVSVLFGLGESQQQRLALLEQVGKWKSEHGNPIAVSANWAVQHPLRGQDHQSNYRYLSWPVQSPEYLEAFRDFGEASEVYNLPGVEKPSLAELLELKRALQACC